MRLEDNYRYQIQYKIITVSDTVLEKGHPKKNFFFNDCCCLKTQKPLNPHWTQIYTRSLQSSSQNESAYIVYLQVQKPLLPAQIQKSLPLSG